MSGAGTQDRRYPGLRFKLETLPTALSANVRMPDNIGVNILPCTARGTGNDAMKRQHAVIACLVTFPLGLKGPNEQNSQRIDGSFENRDREALRNGASRPLSIRSRAPRCEGSIGCCGCSPGEVLRDWHSPKPQSNS
jgi:hypothetical protein